MNSQRVFSVFVCLFSLACFAGGRQPSPQTPKPDASPTAAEEPSLKVTLKSISTSRLSEPLKFDWEIKNEGAVPVYVYSTLLEDSNMRLAQPHIDSEQKTMDVYFLHLTPLRESTYNFPKASFKLLNAGQAMAGTFVSNKPAQMFDEYVLPNNKLARISLTPGAWKVRYAIAYGYEIDSVNAQLEKLYGQGSEHPINPVVRWQKVAYSNSLEVSLR
jgi:hypothetical protein